MVQADEVREMRTASIGWPDRLLAQTAHLLAVVACFVAMVCLAFLTQVASSLLIDPRSRSAWQLLVEVFFWTPMLLLGGYVMALMETSRTSDRLLTVMRNACSSLLRVGRAVGATLGLRRSTRRELAAQAGWGLLCGCAVFGVVVVVVDIIPWPPGASEDPRDGLRGHGVAIDVLVAVLRAPLVEELVFRGPLLGLAAIAQGGRLSPPARRLLIAAALAVTSVVFGWWHLGFSVSNAVTAGLGGVVFGLLALRARSLLPAVLAHAVFNVSVTLVST